MKASKSVRSLQQKCGESPDSYGHVHDVIKVAANPSVLVEAILAGYEVEHTGGPVGHIQNILRHTQSAQTLLCNDNLLAMQHVLNMNGKLEHTR